jgi:hypothetical protein
MKVANKNKPKRTAIPPAPTSAQDWTFSESERDAYRLAQIDIRMSELARVIQNAQGEGQSLASERNVIVGRRAPKVEGSAALTAQTAKVEAIG